MEPRSRRTVRALRLWRSLIAVVVAPFPRSARPAAGDRARRHSPAVAMTAEEPPY